MKIDWPAQTKGHFLLYKLFRDQAAIQLYFATEHFAVISKAVENVAEGGKPEITYFDVLTN